MCSTLDLAADFAEADATAILEGFLAHDEIVQMVGKSCRLRLRTRTDQDN